MDGVVVFDYGVDVAVYITGNDSQYSAAWAVFYPCGRIVLFVGGNILPVAAYEIFACCMASVCYCGDGMLFLCGAVRVHNRFLIGCNLFICAILFVCYEKNRFCFHRYDNYNPFGGVISICGFDRAMQ